VSLDQANLEVLQANARRVHTDVIFQGFLQKQTAEHLSALSELSRISDLKHNNFSLETLGKLELLFQDVSTLQITGQCLEQNVSALQISNKCLENSVEKTQIMIFEVVTELLEKRPPGA
jgi:hypothetical protein